MAAMRVSLVVLVLCAARAATPAAAAPGDIPKWFAGGSYTGTIKYNGLELTGTGSTSSTTPTLSITVFGTELSATYVIDEAELTVDVTWTKGFAGLINVGDTSRGIYKREGSLINLAIAAEPGSPPPKAFSGDSTAVYVIFKPTGVPDPTCPKLTTAPKLSELPAGQWRVLRPSSAQGVTSCAGGTAFAFFVRRASGPDANKVVIHFSGGGGACWSKTTCDPTTNAGTKIPQELLDSVDCQKFAPNGPLGYQWEADNPAANYTQVWVPYCTQDLHFGDTFKSYDKVTARHYGYRNARTVLSWVYDNFAQPPVVAMTGCHEGGYAAMAYAPYVMQRYGASTKVVAIGDSSLGTFTPSTMRRAWGFWGGSCAFQGYGDFIKNLDGSGFSAFATSMRSPALIPAALGRVAATFPNNRLVVLTSSHDREQTSFFEAQGAKQATVDWPRHMANNVDRLSRAGVPSLRVLARRGNGTCGLLTRDQRKWLYDVFQASAATMPTNQVCDDCKIAATVGCDGVKGSGKLLDECGTCTAGGDSWIEHNDPQAASALTCAATLPPMENIKLSECTVAASGYFPRAKSETGNDDLGAPDPESGSGGLSPAASLLLVAAAATLATALARTAEIHG